jgi:hypothetical protein
VNRRTARYTGFGLFVLLLTFGGLAVADDPIFDPNEPPVRLKKKKKADADKATDNKPEPPKKDGAAKKDAEPDKPKPKKLIDPEEERQRLVERVLKNMKEVEERLAKNNPGLGTREVQRDILKDLDALIEQSKQQPPPQGGRRNQSSKSSKGSQSSGKPKDSRKPKDSGKPKDSAKGQGDKQQKDKKGDKGKDKSRQPKKGGNKDGGGGDSRMGKKDKNKLADLFKDVWGQFPETMRMEMDAYARAKFLPKYDALLKQYYRTISEQDRSKEGE